MRKVNTQIFIRRNMLKTMVIINETTMGNLFGFNDHDISLAGINSHTHLGAVDMKSLKLLV